jgi:hypothetical protein
LKEECYALNFIVQLKGLRWANYVCGSERISSLKVVMQNV